MDVCLNSQIPSSQEKVIQTQTPDDHKQVPADLVRGMFVEIGPVTMLSYINCIKPLIANADYDSIHVAVVIVTCIMFPDITRQVKRC